MTIASKFNPGDIVTTQDTNGRTKPGQWRVISQYKDAWDSTRAASNLESVEDPSWTTAVFDQYITLVTAAADLQKKFSQIDIDKAVTDAIVALTEKAAVLADEKGLCSDYDSFVRDLGLPPRPKTFRCLVPVGMVVAMTITADDSEDAIKKATAAVTKTTFSDFPVNWFRIGGSYGTKTQVYEQ